MNKPKPVQTGILFIMQVTLIQVVTACFSLAMAGPISSHGQEVLEREISLDVERVEFTEVLSLISEQASVKFTYSPKLIETGKSITFHATHMPLGQALTRLLGPDIAYKVLGNQIVLRPAPEETPADTVEPKKQTSLLEENIDIHIAGNVTDQNGDPIPGVNVVIKGTTIGTTTDLDGHYELNVPDADAVLIFTFIGYVPEEVAVGEQRALDVVMVEDIMSLSEVVVVGYGTQEKKEVTGAIAQVSSKDLTTSSAISTSNALAGKMPGLIVNQTNSEPGRDDASIYIRGQGTMGNTAALIVVDGIANRDGISRIDPNDIESITVLKDASAAIYGAQAANGVILITTKRGKEGKPTINYAFNQGFVSPTRKVDLANASLFAKSVNVWAGQQGQANVYTDDQIAQYENGTLPSTDWIESVYKSHSIQRRHSLRLSGGNEKVKYFLSGGSAYQNGLVRTDNTTHYKQYNFRSNVDAQVTNRLKLSLDLAGRKEDRQWLQYEDNTIYAATIRGLPTTPATYEGGLPAAGNNNSNPLAIAQGPGYLNLKRDVFQGTLKGSYDLPFVKGLSVDGFAALDVFSGFEKHFYQPYTYYVEDAGELVAQQGGPDESNAYLRQEYQKQQSVTLNGKIVYENDFGLHHLNAFVAYEQNEIKADTFWVQRKGYESAAIDQLFAGSNDADNSSNNGWSESFARQNYFGRVAYDYQGKYLAQFNFRYDGSSKFPEGNRFGFFPGVSLGWRLADESFMAGNTVVNDLKLRASWGQLGNDRILAYQYVNAYYYGSTGSGYVFDGTDVTVLNPGVAANPNITWETKTTTNVGIDAAFFNAKLSFTGDVFWESRKDILWPRSVTVPDYTGIDLPDENLAETKNRGVELQLNYQSEIGDFRYNIGGNFTYVHSEIVYMDEGDVYPETYQKQEGHIIGSQLAYVYQGIFRTQEDIDNHLGMDGAAGNIGDPYYKDVNGDGEITAADRIRIDKSNIPQMQFGLNLGAAYKGFDFSATFQGQAKVTQYLRYTFNSGTNAMSYFLKNAYSEALNPNGKYPYFNTHNTSAYLSTLWLRNTAFVRLKNIELGYTLPDALTSRVGLERVRFYVNGYNLLTFDGLKKDGLPDPESVDVEGWQFPTTKSINMGLNVTF